MYITHSYLGTSVGSFRCLFFLLLEDYIEAQSQFVRDLDLELERFARNLGDSSAVVRPFAGDIDSTRSQVLQKEWTNRAKREITKTPGILMINVDFDDFDPNEHPWMYLHLGERIAGERLMLIRAMDTVKVRELLSELTEVIKDTEKDIFEEAHKLRYQLTMEDVASAIEAKPGIFGFSIDLIKGQQILQQIFNRMRSK